MLIAYRMLNNHFRFLSKLGRNTANIDDMRVAGIGGGTGRAAWA